MTKKTMEKLRKKSENELEKMYMEYNTEISKFNAQNFGELKNVAKPTGSLKAYWKAKKDRARILTILNQRRHEKNHR